MGDGRVAFGGRQLDGRVGDHQLELEFPSCAGVVVNNCGTVPLRIRCAQTDRGPLTAVPRVEQADQQVAD